MIFIPAVSALLFGLIVGLLSGIFPGPITLFMISRCLEKGKKTALITLLGQISAEVIYATVAFLTVGQKLKAVSTYAPFFNLGTSVFIFIYGLRLFAGKKKKELSRPQIRGEGFFLGFLLGISNPGITVFFLGVYQFFLNQGQFPSSALLFFLLMLALEMGVLLWYIFLFSWILRSQESLSARLGPLHKIVGLLLMLIAVLLSLKTIYEIASNLP